MIAFTVPENCTRCGKKGKLSMMGMPTVQPKKKGKSMVFGYTLTIYVCSRCVKSLIKWINYE